MPHPSAPIGVVHGYGFSGAGSNLWTRAVLRALAANGRDVHVVCQESDPARFDFVSEAWATDASGEKRQTVAPRETPYPGRVTVHVPDLEVLPAYVRPSRPSDYVVYIPDLADAPLAAYIARNARELEAVAKENGVVGWVVNHTVMMAVAAARARARGGAPFAILPHGSAIEYVVKKEQRSRELAEEAARAAGAIWALNGEMEGRIREVFAGLEGLEAKMGRMPVGTDTSVFQLVAREDRAEAAEAVIAAAGAERGRTPEAEAALRQRLEALPAGASDEALLAALKPEDYARSAPDAGLEAKLRGIDWAEAKTLVFVGRLIAAKGMPALMMAFPRVAAAHPGARLLVAGTGGLREALEALAYALAKAGPTSCGRSSAWAVRSKARADSTPNRSSRPRLFSTVWTPLARPTPTSRQRKRPSRRGRSCSPVSSTTRPSARSTGWPTRGRSRRSCARPARSWCPRAPPRACSPSARTSAAWATACAPSPMASRQRRAVSCSSGPRPSTVSVTSRTG